MTHVARRGSSRSALAVRAALAGSLWLLAGTPVSTEAVRLKSPDVVKQLVHAMGERQLTSIAVRHPTESDRYVAALLFPGVQLLLVSARTTAVDYMDSQIQARGYEQVYTALHNGVPESKLFVQDMGADGFRGLDGGTADIVYLRGKDQRILNGDHKAADMSAAEYNGMAAKMDRQYTELVSLLLQAARAHAGEIPRR